MTSEYRRIDMVRTFCWMCSRSTDQEIWEADLGFMGGQHSSVHCAVSRCLQCGLQENFWYRVDRLAALVDGYVSASA